MQLKITNEEYLSILRNRSKSISPSISLNRLLQKVKYLKKKDLKHLATIRNITIDDDDSADNIISALLKDIHKNWHFSHVTKSRIFKNLNLREKVDRNFRRTFLKNHFRHLKLYSNPPS